MLILKYDMAGSGYRGARFGLRRGFKAALRKLASRRSSKNRHDGKDKSALDKNRTQRRWNSPVWQGKRSGRCSFQSRFRALGLKIRCMEG